MIRKLIVRYLYTTCTVPYVREQRRESACEKGSSYEMYHGEHVCECVRRRTSGAHVRVRMRAHVSDVRERDYPGESAYERARVSVRTREITSGTCTTSPQKLRNVSLFVVTDGTCIPTTHTVSITLNQ